MRKAGNYAEVLLWRELKGKKFCGLSFNRQQVIGDFIADFCCESEKIIVEVDGGSHIGREEYDKARDEFLWATGFETIRISDGDVKYNLEYILVWLENRIKEIRSQRKQNLGTVKISPLKERGGTPQA